MVGRGYISKYADEDLCWGEAPTTVAAALLQRQRWAKGAVMNGLRIFKGAAKERKALLSSRGKPTELSEFYAYRRQQRKPHNAFVSTMFWLDSTLYPLLGWGAFGYIFCALYYLATANAPISPTSTASLAGAFVTYYGVRYVAFFSAFWEAVPMIDILRSQQVRWCGGGGGVGGRWVRGGRLAWPLGLAGLCLPDATGSDGSVMRGVLTRLSTCSVVALPFFLSRLSPLWRLCLVLAPTMQCWFSFCFCHTMGVWDALFSGGSKFGWVANTGASNRRSWMEWFNILTVGALVGGIFFRLIAFVLIDDGCAPYENVGAVFFAGYVAWMMAPVARVSLAERLSSASEAEREGKALPVPVPLVAAALTILGVVFLSGWANTRCGLEAKA